MCLVSLRPESPCSLCLLSCQHGGQVPEPELGLAIGDPLLPVESFLNPACPETRAFSPEKLWGSPSRLPCCQPQPFLGSVSLPTPYCFQRTNILSAWGFRPLLKKLPPGLRVGVEVKGAPACCVMGENLPVLSFSPTRLVGV